jgi:hypothetical protein
VPDCDSRSEAEALAGLAGRVTRQGDTLRIRGAGSGVLALISDTSTADRTIVYRYCAFLPALDAHLVRVGFYEGGAYTLVDAASTDQTQLRGPPVVSPDGSRFATVSLDLEAGYDPNGVQVWRVTEYGPRFEWGIDGGDAWGASDPAWVAGDALEFTMSRPTAEPGRYQRTRMVLRILPSGLELVPAR